MHWKVACALALAFAASCTSTVDNGSRGTEPFQPDYPMAQSWALEDRVVSESEYRAAVANFVSCVRDAGYSISDPMLSPVDGLTLLYDITPSGDPDAWSRKLEECNLTHVSHIEPAYVEAREQTMEPSLRAATVTCLRSKGFEPRGTERNVKDFVDSTDGVGTAVTQCVTTSIGQLFPELPDFLKIRW